MCKCTVLVNVALLFLINASRACIHEPCDRQANERILGGDMSQRNSRPFQVALYLRVGALGEIGFCGGSLIHQQWILTAAHCCFHGEDEVTHAQAVLGAYSLYDRYENGRRMITIDEIIVHPNWDSSTFANDLALLRLANVVQSSETIGIVRLPYLDMVASNFAGLGAIISGWGIATDGVTFVSPTLRELLMTVITDPLCNTTYFNNLPPNVICGFSTSSGTCKGDNGGPMTIFSTATQETILVGVATFVSSSGCNNNLPSVFTRVQLHLDWIQDVTGIVLDMRSFIIFGLSLVAVASATVEVQINYHEAIGIPAATRIKEAEDKILANIANDEDRIIGGVIAQPSAHPYMAGLVISFFNTNARSACGASLISTNRLVTAAHCWDAPGQLFVSEFTVVLGSNFLFSGGTRIATSNVAVHPDWFPTFLRNDVAVIYLPFSVTLTNLIQPIDLPFNHLWETFVGEYATAVGFGITSDAQVGVSANAVSRQVDLRVITVAQCAAVFGNNFVQQSTLCTAGTGRVGICGGDSGGPLVVNRNGRNILIGISSFVAANNCEGGHPSAFARVTSFYDFIFQHMY
ncbi:transmembrane protease serine 11D-like [Melitaea cinxia]|uniref:transmembrane protease serine 11D-like n=1 Tax=Melitaea cinxia TaxID=113334 RepID=UPI001E270F96|nr:transmembrane protease serine 11D-like [Melitaea cinxia]